MPFAEVKVIEGVFSDQQKQEIVTRVTDAIVSVEGEQLREKTVVLVEEIKSGDWGIGGNVLRAEDVRSLVTNV
ncbi:MAG TPA: 4-oxalocrotonate tautomerase family protein [Thermoguttaceae bacterium]|nr:4-oxalocrotonate tautomerase family protein [Thermoguttaceae bacterium]